MVSKSKSNTPSVSVPDHPANSLSYGNEDQINALLKLQPIYMPTDKHSNEEVLDKLRSSYQYLYVVNWIYQCRGYTKLQSEYFDVDLFEIELLNMVYPPPIDESVLFINKLKLALITTLQNSKCSSINNFEKIFRLWFGLETPLAGNEDEEDETPEPKFDNLLIEDKFEILFTLISYITQYQSFRSYLDKNNVSSDLIRVTSVYSEDIKDGTTEDYILLFDNTKLYKRTIKFPELSIPKKRKLAPEIPEDFFEPEQFDIESTSFEMISKNIYEFNSLLLDMYGKRKLKKYKTLYSNLADDIIFESIFNAEIKKRKILSNRRKELQLANLLATRKKSSRLEAKEKQRQDELRLLKLQEEEELKVAGEKRLERRRMMKEQGFNPNHDIPNSINTLSREDRLKLRKLTSQSNKTTANPEIESQTTNVVKSEGIPVENGQAQANHSNEIGNFVSDNNIHVADTSIDSLDSGTKDNSIVGEQNNVTNTSNVSRATDSLPEHPLENVHNIEQAAAYQVAMGESQVSNTTPFPIQSGVYENPIQKSDNIPTQPIHNSNAHAHQTQTYDSVPPQVAQNLEHVPEQQGFTSNVVQMDLSNEPSQIINKISTNIDQSAQRDATLLSNADSTHNFDHTMQTHETQHNINH